MKQSQAWRFTSVIPTAQEAEIGGLQFEAKLSKSQQDLISKTSL
jgi:hypothetical protein